MEIKKQTEITEDYLIIGNDGSGPFSKSTYQIIVLYKNEIPKEAYLFSDKGRIKIEDLPSALNPIKDEKSLDKLVQYLKKFN